MKKIILLIFTALSLNLYSQINDAYNNFYLHKIDTSMQRVYIGTNSVFESSSVNSAFFNKILTKDYIDNSLKDANNILSQNYIYSENTNVISYILKPDSFMSHTDVGFKIDVVNVNRITSMFTRDAFNIAFYGNKKYAGKTADFTNSYYNSMTYQKINFGLFKHAKSDEYKNRITYYAGFSIINGQDNKAVDLYNSNIYTSETGEYIDFNFQMDYYYAKNGKTNFLENRGIGGAFNFNLTYENVKNDFFVNLSVEDLGVIKWSSYSYYTYVDSSYHFEGIEIPDVLDLDNYSTSNLSKDSLTLQITDRTKRLSYTTMLNEKVNLSISKNLKKNNFLTTIGAGYLHNTYEPIPVFYLKTMYKINKLFSVYAQTSYGGFTNFRYGLGFLVNYKRFNFLAGTNSVLGFIYPDNTLSQNIYLRAGFSL